MYKKVPLLWWHVLGAEGGLLGWHVLGARGPIGPPPNLAASWPVTMSVRQAAFPNSAAAALYLPWLKQAAVVPPACAGSTVFQNLIPVVY